jgi:hypothetical protein
MKEAELGRTRYAHKTLVGKLGVQRPLGLSEGIALKYVSKK